MGTPPEGEGHRDQSSARHTDEAVPGTAPVPSEQGTGVAKLRSPAHSAGLGKITRIMQETSKVPKGLSVIPEDSSISYRKY